MKLSKAQIKVLEKMESGKWYSAYNLGCSIATLRALKAKRLLEERGGDNHGAIWFARTIIEFRKKNGG